MSKLIFIILLTAVAGSALAMGGAPVFINGPKVTSLAVEGAHAVMDLNSPTSTVAHDKFLSDRVMLSLRYGLPFMDISGQVGTAGLNFKDLPAGYSDYDANWAPAWGADVRAGYPGKAQPYQVVLALKYFGFRPHGTTGNGQRSIESKYLWHEVTPTLTAGYIVGPVVPYVGAAKPYLFGEKDFDVILNGQEFPSAGGKSNYSDDQQPVRGLLGVEWRGPEGYSIAAEAAVAAKGVWTVSLGISQVLK